MSATEHYHVKLASHDLLAYAFCDRGATADVALHCRDGVVRVHRLVLVGQSQFAAELLRLVPPGGQATVILRDYSCAEVQLLAELLYKGQVSVGGKAMGRLTELMDELKIEGSSQRAPPHFQ